MYQIIDLIFTIIYALFIIRIILSWVPHNPYHPLVSFVYNITNPILRPFQDLIPPIGGTIDISPMVALLALQLLKKLIFMLLF